MNKRIFVLLLAFVVFAWVAASPAVAQDLGLTPANPIKVEAKEHAVSILAQVNGKYLVQSTRHGVVFKDGKNGDKSIFIALVDPKGFYEALTAAGIKPGNNMTMDNKEKTSVQGDALDVTVTWKGAKKTYRFDEVVKDSNAKPIDIRFGGNLPAALEYKTGCLLCLDSCPVGVTSNATYTYGAVEGRKEVGFTGNKDVLPPDHSLVVITFKLKA